jgi:hypothetical protein
MLAPGDRRIRAADVTKGRDEALGLLLVGAVGVAEDAGELGFLDPDAPQQRGQRQHRAADQRQPVADRETESGDKA